MLASGASGSRVPGPGSRKQHHPGPVLASGASGSRVPGPESRLARPESRPHLIYGGTFDPFHNGHLAIARLAGQTLQVPVTLVPAADPPHRPPPGANAGQRLAMLEAAVAGDPGLRVDRRELDRPGPSYTVDTLRELRAELGPQAPLALLIGADSFLGLPDWHQWQALFGLAHLVVAERADTMLEQLPAVLAEAVAARWTSESADLQSAPAGRVLRLHQPLQAESASDVRARIAAGQSWQALVPPAVAAFIMAHGLYGAAAL
nr:nicotinate-nucleotide adenylyltransferase [Pseudoxanthomonas spadix]